MKIVNLESYPANPGDLNWKGLEDLGEVTTYDRTALTDEKEILARIGDAEVVLLNKVQMTRSIIEAAPHLKMIAEQATGYNNIDIEAAKEHGVVVSNVPAYSTDSVAQSTFALLLEITQRVGHHSTEVFDGRWEKGTDWTFFDYPLIELAGKTIGIVGFGNIGQRVGEIAKAFGMKVLAYNRSQSERGKEIASYVSLDDIYEQADVISLHIPLTDQTEQMINKETIAKMKDNVVILNTARGQLLNEQDFADALNSGKIFAAGLDVVSVEPIESSNPLLKAKNCYITPHIAWAPVESRQRLINQVVENVAKFKEGHPINVVNK